MFLTLKTENCRKFFESFSVVEMSFNPCSPKKTHCRVLINKSLFFNRVFFRLTSRTDLVRCNHRVQEVHDGSRHRSLTTSVSLLPWCCTIFVFLFLSFLYTLSFVGFRPSGDTCGVYKGFFCTLNNNVFYMFYIFFKVGFPFF